MIRTKDYLKNKFSAGMNPTTSDYQDLVDSLYGSLLMFRKYEDVDWNSDSQVPSAKAIYEEFRDQIDAVMEILERVVTIEDDVDAIAERIKTDGNVDWDSDSDVPTALPIKNYVIEYLNERVLLETGDCLYVD
jgi:hypothetical protein